MASSVLKCDQCDQPATVHASQFVGGVKQELHLCRRCAEQRNLIASDEKLNLPAITKTMAGTLQVHPSELAKLRCPDCGTTYMDFRKTGRLGCPYDYVIFRSGLLPLLERVHRGSRHEGKRPRARGETIETHSELRSLRFQLKQAVEAEDFEKAARLRDMIRTKEHIHGP